MSKTTNIGLNLTEAENTKFADWRKSIDGNNAENKSNMQIIDENIGKLNTDINEHKTASDSHNDIRLLVTELTNRLNALADSDDITLDQLSEIVAYIKSNKTLIESVTTSKVNVTDIIDNLTTSVTNKPLSAKQGVELKALIDALNTALTNHTSAEVVDGTARASIADHETRINVLEGSGGGISFRKVTVSEFQALCTESNAGKLVKIVKIQNNSNMRAIAEVYTIGLCPTASKYGIQKYFLATDDITQDNSAYIYQFEFNIFSDKIELFNKKYSLATAGTLGSGTYFDASSQVKDSAIDIYIEQ